MSKIGRMLLFLLVFPFAITGLILHGIVAFASIAVTISALLITGLLSSIATVCMVTFVLFKEWTFKE